MSTEKAYLTVRVEVEYYVDEEYDREEYKYPEVIESVLPVDVHTGKMSPEVLRAARDFLNNDDDASFDFMWDLRSLIEKKEKASEQK